jgi:hypothetical protein
MANASPYSAEPMMYTGMWPRVAVAEEGDVNRDASTPSVIRAWGHTVERGGHTAGRGAHRVEKGGTPQGGKYALSAAVLDV